MTTIKHRASRRLFPRYTIRTVAPLPRFAPIQGHEPSLPPSIILPLPLVLFLTLAVLPSRSAAVCSPPPLYLSSSVRLRPRLAPSCIRAARAARTHVVSLFVIPSLSLSRSRSLFLSLSHSRALHKLCMSSMYIIYTDLAPEHRATANAGSRIAGEVRALQFSSSRRSACIIDRSAATPHARFSPRRKQQVATRTWCDRGTRSRESQTRDK